MIARAREATGGGAEVVVDTTPYAPQSLNHAIAIAVRKGRIVVAGLKGRRLANELPVDDVIFKELTIRGVLTPGLGQLKIRGLRTKAQAALGPAFDVRASHDELLDDDGLPLSILEAKMDR